MVIEALEPGGGVEKKPLQEFLERLEEILTSDDPKGYYQTAKQQREWKRTKEHWYSKDGEDALTNLFPNRGHRQFTNFLNALKRAGISTPSQLIGHKDKIERIKHIGSKRAKAAKLIIRFFEAQKA